MADGVKDWGEKPRKSSVFVLDSNPAYGLDLDTTRRQIKQRASVVGAKAVVMSKQTAKAFRNRPYQSAVVFASILNMLMLFAATTNLTWYFQELHVRSSVVRTTLTWDALQTCVSDSTNMRTQNTSREICSVVYLGDIRLDQDYLRQAGWSAFSCNFVALFFLAFAAYSSYLARVGRTYDVIAVCRPCLSRRESPGLLHGAVSLLVLSACGSFSSLILGNLPSDPTTLNPARESSGKDRSGFGAAYELTVAVLILEVACVAVSLACCKEEDRNPDDFGDDAAPDGAGFPPTKGGEAAAEFDAVYAAQQPAGPGAAAAAAAVPGDGHVTVHGAPAAKPAPAPAPAAAEARPAVPAVPPARSQSTSGPTVRPAAPAVPPRRSAGGPGTRKSVTAGDAAAVAAADAALDSSTTVAGNPFADAVGRADE